MINIDFIPIYLWVIYQGSHWCCFICFFQEQSNYEKERMQKVKENDLLLLKSGLVSVLNNP